MKRFWKTLLALAILTLAAGLLGIGWGYHTLSGSLPLLEGEMALAGLEASVIVERDHQGVPTIRAENRLDAARALGFVHAQERFFQMDLLRRQAAGELAELLGEPALEIDRATRLHQFRSRAERVVRESSAEERLLLEAYVQGVHAGLQALRKKPFEYVVLQTEPADWRPEDSVLAVDAMFLVLNDDTGREESARGLLYDLLPEELARFLAPPGTEWDAPLIGHPFATEAIPGPELYDVRQRKTDIRAARLERTRRSDWLEQNESLLGSNNWAVTGRRTARGKPLLANDMHLGLSVPNTWYRVMFEWPGGDDCGDRHRLLGVTLPGVPAIVAGSNTHVAWGFTNSMGDWVDLVVLETDPEDPGRYLTPDGYRRFEESREILRSRDGEPEQLQIHSTIWGPVIDQDHLGRLRALHWTAHDAAAVNLRMLDLEHALTVQQAQLAAHQSGIPPQNFVCADEHGDIGWTIMGRIPRRTGFSGLVPVSWADGSCRWDGWLDPEQYPRVVNPDSGILWTANARVVEGDMLARVGHGGYDHGARAKQIRDALLLLDRATEADLLAVELDDRAVFLERWRDLLLALLTDEAVEDHPERMRFRKLVQKTWTGRASVDSVAYRLVRAFRASTFERVYGWLTAPCKEVDERFSPYDLSQWEGPLWNLVIERPPHLLDAASTSWEEALLAVVDEVIESLRKAYGGNLEDRTWGERNTTLIQHPLSRAVPMLSRWLDMPRVALPGDSNMPRVQHPSQGASERFVVSPGLEAQGIFHMPSGQSGHPLSAHYRAGHDDWVEGRPSPFLPGPTQHVLTLHPK